MASASNSKTRKTKKKVPKKAATSKSTKKAAKKAKKKVRKPAACKTDSVELAVDALDVIEDLLDVAKQPEQPTRRSTATRKHGPRTPSVPRTVKPTPKVADLEMDASVLEFIDAIDKYKQEYSRPFPSWREVYYVFSKLGYTQSK